MTTETERIFISADLVEGAEPPHPLLAQWLRQGRLRVWRANTGGLADPAAMETDCSQEAMARAVSAAHIRVAVLASNGQPDGDMLTAALRDAGVHVFGGHELDSAQRCLANPEPSPRAAPRDDWSI
ncbi:hypothetical protein [Paludibacterium paludis]|uniref:Uncharacterized protein n=1 Tax=Paludibacterium paludis TaxID=1225769 RepID=A0A918U8Y0_9NEIS|nr:hypothetical protein [Paludibacterium paludis]GGY11908.1 hypothetical protein GCM10011289_13530 [Paludibacterium paludis]